ncbi:MAG: hypothetical protein AAF561_16540, partial [Planctomycetota bacterium]
EYVELLAAAYEEIKAVDPDAIIISGGMASIEHRHAKLDLYDMLFGEHTDIYDWFGYHRHGPFHHFVNDIDQLLARREAAGGEKKPFYFNETGLYTDRPGEYAMAEDLAKKLAYSWALGAKGYHWFCLWVPERDRENSAYGFRMFNEDFTPRPVWVAYNTVARYLRGREFSHTLDLGDGRYGYAFRGDGVFTGDGSDDYVLVVWTQDQALAPAILALDAEGAESVAEINLMGVSKELETIGESVVLRVGHEPTLVAIDGARDLPADFEPIVEAAPGLTLLDGQTSLATITVSNPLPEALSVELQWSARGGVTLDGDQPQTVEERVSAGAAASFTRAVRLNNAVDIAGGPAGFVDAKWRLSPDDAWQVASIPVLKARAVGTVSDTQREPDFTLNRADQVVNNSEVDPETFAFRWLGPDDLSADVWITAEEGMLDFRIDVNDDQHRQPNGARSMWKGDSVQLGIELPELRGFWELGVALSDDGETITYSWGVPAGVDREVSPWRDLSIKRLDTTTQYRFGLDLETLGKGEALGDRLNFNILVNESDSDFREGYIQLAPGIAESKNPALFVPLQVESVGASE